MKEISAQDILEFWFNTLDQSQWWSQDDALDETIRPLCVNLFEQV